MIERLLLLLSLLALTGCSFAPRDRLTFPAAPLVSTPQSDGYDTDADGKADFFVGYTDAAPKRVASLGYDDDADGTVDRAYAPPHASDDAIPHVVVCLDSIPYAWLMSQYDAGRLLLFNRPQKMVAPFPALTELCYSELFNTPPLPTHIDTQYDPRLGKNRSDLWKRVKGYEQPWERYCAYHAGYAGHGLSFLAPRKWYAGEMALCYEAIEESPDKTTYVYTASAASLLCKQGERGAEQVLEGLNQLCLQLMHERRGAIHISVLSDHGHDLVPPKNIDLPKLLKSKGFKPAKTLASNDDVIVSANGLVTCGFVHTRQPARVAAALANEPWLEMAMYKDGSRVMLVNSEGMAAVESVNGRFRYTPLTADVLGYKPAMDGMTLSESVDGDGWADETVWFNATLDEHYPNGPPRVWHALHRLTVQPAPLVLSVRDGYCVGKPEYEKFVKMQSTHGGLNQASSATFVMSTTDRVKRPLQHREVFKVLSPEHPPRMLK